MAYVIGTDYMSPDVDLRSNSGNKSKILWFPYRKTSKHRGMSHTILGIFIRIIYVSIVIVLISLLFNQFDVLVSFSMNVKMFHYMLFVAGITVSNIVHILLDKIF